MFVFKRKRIYHCLLMRATFAIDFSRILGMQPAVTVMAVQRQMVS